MKKLVAYFSPTGTTKRLAKTLSKAADADLFEIKPKIAYTSADLDWMNKQSRSSLEMSDKSSRPEIAEKARGMNEYDTVFIGFPIWWYTAPTIIAAFIESYDFSGKTVVLFATSGGSGMGDTLDDLKPLGSDSVKWIGGKVMNPDTSEAELSEWVSATLNT